MDVLIDPVVKSFAEYRSKGDQRSLTSAYQALANWRNRYGPGAEFFYLMRKLISDDVSYEIKSGRQTMNQAIILKGVSTAVDDEYCKTLLSTASDWKERNSSIVALVRHFAKPRSYFWNIMNELNLEMELYDKKLEELEGVVLQPKFSRPSV